MNKRISTLFATSLLFSTVFGTAFAEKLPYGDPVSTVKSGSKYFFVQDMGGDNKNAFGFTEKGATTITTDILKLSDDFDEKVGVKAYIWTVTKDSVPSSTGFNYIYKLKNELTQTELLFDNATGMLNVQVNPTNVTSGVVLPDYADYKDLVAATEMLPWILADKTTPSARFLGLGSTLQLFEQANAGKFYFYEVADQEDQDVITGDLNELYNRQGFSFALEDENITNIFGQKIYAYKSDGHTLDADKELGIPAGTYFFTDLVLIDEEGDIDDKNIDWLNSTFIVVSSTETEEVTKADKEAGNGYVFVTKKGSELNTYRGGTASLKSDGTQIPICNAAFTVVKSVSGDYPYALKLENFRYNLPTEENEKYHNEKPMYIGITNHSGSDYLTTNASASSYEYIFKKAQSTIKKGIELLNTDGTAAIYNIKFVSGQGEDSEYNKYLTVGVEGKQYEWIAKGSVLTDTDAPESQFVITAVDADNNITFTNRETGKSIEVQLFNEEGCYSVAEKAQNTTKEITPVTINTNTYAVTKNDAVDLDQSLIVLEPVSSVDQYAGFLNVDDKSEVTLAYARDNNITSNKYYTSIKNTGTISAPVYTFANNEDYVTTELYEAAQFQLVKSPKAEKLTRSYVYNNNGTITYQTNADVVSAYTYALQYITDGMETGYYLQGTTTGEWELKKTDDPMEFTIKVNKDGSVTLVKDNVSFLNTPNTTEVFGPNIQGVGKMTVTNNSTVAFGWDEIYPVEVKDDALNIYLVSEALEVSWPTETGHVSLQSELGNYISMNEDHDGIVVTNEEEVYYLNVTDVNKVVPSFYISRGVAGAEDRLFLFNPTDSVDYQVNEKYDLDYQWTENVTKAIFKEGHLASADTMVTNIKGNIVNVSNAQNNTDGTLAGLDKFKFQIIECDDADSYYYIRQNGQYLASWNEKLTWDNKAKAMKFHIESVEAPTANEGVSTTEVKVVAYDGAINIKNAAGKNVVVSTILGQIVANEVLTSDNATISVPAGIAIVSVEGEEAVKVSVK